MITIFADWTFYTEEYRVGDAPIIPENAFHRLERSAAERINWRKVELDEIPERLKMATCEVAELLWNQELFNGECAIASTSNQGFSESYRDNRLDVRTLDQTIRGIVNKWLASSELHDLFVWRGVG